MSKSLLYDQSFLDAQRYFLIIDTTALIDASKSIDFYRLLINRTRNNCAFITIPSVVYEFTRGAKSFERLNEFNEILDQLRISAIDIERQIHDKKMSVFTFVYNNATQKNREKGPSYTDALLCLMAYHYRGVSILTANHKDIPGAIFDRNDLITVDVGGELRTHAIYDLNQDKYDKLLDKFLKED